ncbi:Cobyric acid synthase [hydrothermal vent metagenome]|uniref:Cobyric acid synthase n=1 Tax=hydrothermal vent metagenome TaxID=652676 RepID=A0A3B0QW92_9ZZZZ
MIQGTSSHAGKSVITAAICRILSDNGLRVAPFKAQNMSLNSFITTCGGEVGRAQAFQAEAARCELTPDMNPVLLKPTGDQRSQVIIQGKVHSNMAAREFHAFKKEAMKYVLESYNRLAEDFDVIVMEGAGSPAEINLRENDIANMGTALAVGSPVLIVGDIDRGGIFASLVGTMELLSPPERELVKGFIINRFRGDVTLLDSGLEFLQEKTGVVTLGVIPFIEGLGIHDEDGLSIEVSGSLKAKESGGDRLRIVVPRLPRISNFTDFDPLRAEPLIDFDYIDGPEGLSGADLLILPGTKNTIADFGWLRERGICDAIKVHHSRGGMIGGICGGYQMLGRTISDPEGVEGEPSTVDGLGLIDVETVLAATKTTVRAKGRAGKGLLKDTEEVSGYEIHMGVTTLGRGSAGGVTAFAGLVSDGRAHSDGAVSKDGLVWGTYLHGLFDSDSFRGGLVNLLREKRGLSIASTTDFEALKEASIVRLSTGVEEAIGSKKLMEIIGLPVEA